MKIRYQKLDILRGGALIGMIFFHANYILKYIFQIDISYFSETFWFILGRMTAVLFILIAGISFFISSSNKNLTQIFKSSIKRSLLLLGCAILISSVTYATFYEQRISFGILHFFALASLLNIFFFRFKKSSIFLGICFLAGGYYLNSVTSGTNYFAFLGLVASNFYSADYYPIFPWYGYYLIGYGAAYFLSEKGYFAPVFSGSIRGFSLVEYIGKHSLFIYMIHVPILYSIFFVFFSI